MDGTVRSRVETAIYAALEENPAWDSLAVTSFVIAANAGIVEAWTRDMLYALVKRIRGRKAPSPLQMYFEGFASLDARLPLDDGVVRLRAATISVLRKSLIVMQAMKATQPDPKLEAIQALIDKMAPYSNAKHGITVEEYVQLAAAGTPPPAIPYKRTPEEQSEISKRIWARRGKKERREIGRKIKETIKKRRQG